MLIAASRSTPPSWTRSMPRHRARQMTEELYQDDELIGLAVDGKAMRGTCAVPEVVRGG
jgi:hypothetical protein